MAIAIVASTLAGRCQTALYCIIVYGLLQWIGWPYNCWIVPLITAVALFAPIPGEIRHASIGPVFILFTTVQIFIDPVAAATASAVETFRVLQGTLALTSDLQLVRWVLVPLSFTALGLLDLRIRRNSITGTGLPRYYAAASVITLVLCTFSFVGNPAFITPTWGLVSG